MTPIPKSLNQERAAVDCRTRSHSRSLSLDPLSLSFLHLFEMEVLFFSFFAVKREHQVVM